jgi:hypothetical protein
MFINKASQARVCWLRDFKWVMSVVAANIPRENAIRYYKAQSVTYGNSDASDPMHDFLSLEVETPSSDMHGVTPLPL